MAMNAQLLQLQLIESSRNLTLAQRHSQVEGFKSTMRDRGEHLQAGDLHQNSSVE